MIHWTSQLNLSEIECSHCFVKVELVFRIEKKKIIESKWWSINLILFTESILCHAWWNEFSEDLLVDICHHLIQILFCDFFCVSINLSSDINLYRVLSFDTESVSFLSVVFLNEDLIVVPVKHFHVVSVLVHKVNQLIVYHFTLQRYLINESLKLITLSICLIS